jgi:hypothetical protein
MDRRPPEDIDTLPPIAGGAQDDLPLAGAQDEPAQPPTLEEQVAQALRLAEEAKQRAERAELDAGRLINENAALRTRLDSREALGLGYQPAVGADAGGIGPPQQGERVQDYLTRVLTTGLDDQERSMPTAETVAKLILKSAPLFDDRITQRLQDHTARQRMDAAYFEHLADDWGRRTGKSYRPSDLQTRHGERIGQIAQRILVDPQTGALLPQYRNNAQAAFQKITETLERELNMVVEDAPSQKPKSRLSTGDAGTSRLPTSPNRPGPSQSEMESLRRYATGR